VEHGQITLGREQSARLLALGIRFFLAAALTASQTPGGYAPFALGIIAAAGAGVDGAAAVVGAVLGAVLFLEFETALPYLAVGVLILAAATAFRGMKGLARPGVLAAVAAGLHLAVGGIYAVQSLSPLEDLTSCLAAAGLTGAAAWFFHPLLQTESDRPVSEGVLFLAAAFLLALSDVVFAGLSLGRMLLCVLLAYTAYDRGTVTGVSVGLGLGLTADLCAGTGSGIFTAGLGLAGLLSGSRSGCRRSEAAMAFLLAAGVALLPAREPLAQPLLMEAAAGMVLFLMLPGRLFGGKRVKRAAAGQRQENRIRSQLNKAAAAFRDLYDSMGRNVPQMNEENPAVLFDRAAEKVCRGCVLCDLCWQKEYTGTFNALNDATPFLLERGRGLAKDFPQYFTDRCIHLPEFIGAINVELSAFLLRRQYRRQLEETRRSAKGQYAQLSEILSATAAGLDAERMENVCCCRIGAVLRPKNGETVCGDTVASFQTENGKWCMLLADGMGSGDAARRESALACRLLQQFLEADIQPEAALKTLNAAMALRTAEQGGFTTVDLCVFDPQEKEAAFYKYGAAPSYLKRRGAVRRVAGGSLPVGLRGMPPDVTRAPLEDGSFVVMISDGVADSGKDEWLMDLLAGWDGEDPQELAGLILTESIQREQLKDDCGVQVLYCESTGVKRI